MIMMLQINGNINIFRPLQFTWEGIIIIGSMKIIVLVDGKICQIVGEYFDARASYDFIIMTVLLTGNISPQTFNAHTGKEYL